MNSTVKSHTPPTKNNQGTMQLMFPTVVMICDLENHHRYKAALIKQIDSTRQSTPNRKPQSWACNVYTTIGDKHSILDDPALKDFRDVINQKISAYARSMEYDISKRPPFITESWINVYQSTQAQEIHLHKNSVISGIYYVAVPEGSGATLFYSPMADSMLEPDVVRGNQLNARVSGIEPREGRLLLFRSSLKHSVQPGDMQGERITIAFNAMV